MRSHWLASRTARRKGCGASPFGIQSQRDQQRHLLCTLPGRPSVSKTGGWSRIAHGEFVPRKFDKSFLISTPPVRERTALNMICNDFTILAHRVCTVVRYASLHGCLVFFGSSCFAIGGREFGNIRTDKHYGKVTVRVENHLA